MAIWNIFFRFFFLLLSNKLITIPELTCATSVGDWSDEIGLPPHGGRSSQVVAVGIARLRNTRAEISYKSTLANPTPGRCDLCTLFVTEWRLSIPPPPPWKWRQVADGRRHENGGRRPTPWKWRQAAEGWRQVRNGERQWKAEARRDIV